MAKNIIRHVFGIALILAMIVLGTHTVACAHAHAYDEDHCQVCHIGHAAIPQPAVQVAAQVPVQSARFVPAENSAPELQRVRALSSPRAPPTA